MNTTNTDKSDERHETGNIGNTGVEKTTINKNKNITIDKSGNYNWMYEFSLCKNPVVLITCFKVCLIGILAPAILMFLLTIEEGLAEAVKIFGMIIFYGILLMIVLLLLAYSLISFIYKGKYFVLFKMDEKGISHMQLDKQFKKARALECFSILLGGMTKSPTLVGSNLLAATRNSLYTEFKKVKSIKIAKAFNTIYLNGTLKKNQVYAEKEDFEFVKDFILEKCPNTIKIIGK